MARTPSTWEEPEFTEEDLGVRTRWRRVAKVQQSLPPGIFKDLLTGVWAGATTASKTFLLSKTDLTVPEAESAHWEPVKLLGEGGFGLCGLWVKVDDATKIIDEIVIKEAKQYLECMDILPHIQREAALQRDMQRQERDRLAAEAGDDQYENYPVAWKERHIPHLRHYKYNTKLETCRFLMEYCRHIDLRTLQRRYSAWCEFLPETFLWWILLSLARACTLLDRSPHSTSLMRRLEQGDAPPGPVNYEDWFGLHLDMKPDNILLTGPREEYTNSLDGTSAQYPLAYPTIVLGDWGLARYTTAEKGKDDFNPDYLRGGGTSGYRGVEQLVGHPEYMLFQEYRERPVEVTDKITSALNVWNVGKVVYDLMLQVQGEYGADLTDLTMKTLSETDYKKFGNHFLDPDYGTQRRPEYSKELRNLIRRCLSPRPSERPTATGLQYLALTGLRTCQQALDTSDRTNSDGEVLERLFYRNNEINQMPTGAGKWPLREDLLTELRQNEDPDFPLQLPRQKWGRLHKLLRPGQMVKSARRAPDGMIIVEHFSDLSDSTATDGDKSDSTDDSSSSSDEQWGRGKGKGMPGGGPVPDYLLRRPRDDEQGLQGGKHNPLVVPDDEASPSAQEQSWSKDDASDTEEATGAVDRKKREGQKQIKEGQAEDNSNQPEDPGLLTRWRRLILRVNPRPGHGAEWADAEAGSEVVEEDNIDEQEDGGNRQDEDYQDATAHRSLPPDAIYQLMTMAEMRDELEHRAQALPGRNKRKSEHLRCLKAADAAGKFGRGAYGVKVPKEWWDDGSGGDGGDGGSDDVDDDDEEEEEEEWQPSKRKRKG